MLALTGQYRSAERVVLSRDHVIIAAAVVQMHASRHVLEVPIFASRKSSRKQGHGSALAMLLLGIGRVLGMRSVIISATDESRAFWIKQGFHVASFSAPSEKTAMRALEQAGLVHAFSNSVLMATPITVASAPFQELGDALARCGAHRIAGLSARKAAAALSCDCACELNPEPHG